MADRPSIRSDIAGGAAGAIVALPLILSCGAVSYQTLGPEFAATGTAAAFMTAIVAAVIAGMASGPPLDMSAPKSSHAGILSVLLAQAAAIPAFTSGAAGLPGGAAAGIIAIGLMALIVAGVTQALLGALRTGRLVKFLPQPVLGGLLDGFLAENVLHQGPRAAGVTHSHFAVNPFALAIAVIAGGLTLWAQRRKTRVPGAILGLAGATAVYLAAASLIEPARLGPVVGALPSFISIVPRLSTLWATAQLPGFDLLWPAILATGFSLAMVASMESLFSLASGEELFEQRYDSNKELLVQGAANAAVGLLGGTPTGSQGSATKAAHKAGARSRVANFAHAAILFALYPIFSHALGYIPLSALAGVVLVLQVGSIDAWSLQLFRDVIQGRADEHRTAHLFNLGMIVLVAVLVVSAGAVPALGVGVFLTVVLFLRRTSQAALRRIYYGDAVRSRTQRLAEDDAILDREGRRIAVIELQGQLFFGSAEVLRERVEAEAGTLRWAVLDFRRVQDMDITAALTLKRLDATLQRKSATLLIASVPPDSDIRRLLSEARHADLEAEGRLFEDTDSALAHAEDGLIAEVGGAEDNTAEFSLADVDVLREMTPAELARLESYGSRREVPAGETILHQGDPGDSLFFLLKGGVQITAVLGGHRVRLARYQPGAIVGEMALLTNAPRSADVVAGTNVVIRELSRDALHRLQEEEPGCTAKLLAGIAIQLSGRVRDLTRTVGDLQS